MTSTTVAFVGLGDLGLAMALRLAHAGFAVVGYDVRPIERDVDWPGCFRLAGSLEDALAAAEAVHICVAYDHDMAALLDPLVTAAAGRCRAVIVHSTVLPATVVRLDEVLSPLDVAVVDCPVSGGGRRAAEAGALTLIVGAEAPALVRCRPLLAALGSTLVEVGGVGAGQAAKLANNVMSHLNRVGYLEAVRLALRYGVSEEVLNQVARRSSGGSWVQEHFDVLDRHGREHTLAGTPEHGYRYAKDLRYAVAAAHAVSLPLPVTGLVAELAPALYAERWAQDAEPPTS